MPMLVLARKAKAKQRQKMGKSQIAGRKRR
jgi:hypothetical protein